VSLHHLLGGADRVHRAELRVLRHEIRCHGIAVSCDDAGHDQQQRPERDENIRQKLKQKTVQEIVEPGKQVTHLCRLAAVELQEKGLQAKRHRSAEDKLDQADRAGCRESRQKKRRILMDEGIRISIVFLIAGDQVEDRADAAVAGSAKDGGDQNRSDGKAPEAFQSVPRAGSHFRKTHILSLSF